LISGEVFNFVNQIDEQHVVQIRSMPRYELGYPERQPSSGESDIKKRPFAAKTTIIDDAVDILPGAREMIEQFVQTGWHHRRFYIKQFDNCADELRFTESQRLRSSAITDGCQQSCREPKLEIVREYEAPMVFYRLFARKFISVERIKRNIDPKVAICDGGLCNIAGMTARLGRAQSSSA
jgi:hypothetical protein